MRTVDLDENLGAAARLAVMASLYAGAPLSFRRSSSKPAWPTVISTSRRRDWPTPVT